MAVFSKQVTLPLLIGISLTGVGLGVLYILYKMDREDDDERTVRSIRQKAWKAIEINVPKQFVPVIIGRGGGTIKEIESKTSTRINFDDDDLEKPYRICYIRGSPEEVKLAEALIDALIASQPVIEIYEMQVPQRFCSYLLSNRGQVINEIQSFTNSKIIIEKGYLRDPGAKRKVIIKGTAEQIAAALSQIEDTLRDFTSINEKMALGQSLRSPRGNVSFRRTNVQNLTTRADVFSIPEGMKEVYVSATESPGQFWAQVVGSGILALDDLVKVMTEYYSDAENHTVHKLHNITIGQTVAAKFSFDNSWYRAEITSFIGNGQYEVHFVDYGDYEVINETDLLELRTDFLSLRFQAIAFTLANVEPKDDDWSREVCDRFDELVHCAQWKPLIAKVCGFKEKPTTRNTSQESCCSRKESSLILAVDLFDKNNNQELSIGQQLVIENLAIATAEENNWSSKPNYDNSTSPMKPNDAAASEITTPPTTPLASARVARVVEEIDLVTPIKLPEEIVPIDLVSPSSPPPPPPPLPVAATDEPQKCANVGRKTEIPHYINGKQQYHETNDGVSPSWKRQAESPIPGGYEDDYTTESDDLEMF